MRTNPCPLINRIVMLLCAGLLCAASVSSAAAAAGLPRAKPEEVGMSSARLSLVTAMLKQHVDDGRVAGLVAGVARHGKLVYLQSLGWQDIAQQQAMTDDSIFQIRSMSKPITAVAVLQLIEAGKISLADPVAKYLPAFGQMQVLNNPSDSADRSTHPVGRSMTIEDLLLNTSGLSHRFSALYRHNKVRSRADNLQQLVAKVAAQPLVADPGTKWIYSIASTVLGRIVEVVTGQGFDEYLATQLFAPLLMPDTGFYVSPEQRDRLARAYSIPTADKALSLLPVMTTPITEQPALMEGAAGLVSTVPDYLRFMQMLLNQGLLDGERVLAADTVKVMVKNQLDDRLLPIATHPAYPMLDRGWGYGVAVVIDPAQSAFGVNLGEFGWAGSLATFSWADPTTDTVAILMLQLAPASAYQLSSKFKALVYQSLIDR